MFFGYARISTTQQKLALQLDALLKYGVKEKNIYADKVSGATKERESLNTVLDKLREGDTLVVWKIDRIARSVSHLTKLINDFESREINLVSIQEPFLDTTSSYGKFIFTIFAAIAELERSIIIERTVAGLESAKRRGVKIGRKYGLSEDALNKARIAESYFRDSKNNLSIKDICTLSKIKSKSTLYKYLEYRGKRNCKECGVLFWDKPMNDKDSQDLDKSYCKKHIHLKENEKLLKKLQK
jgi:DNA invertase Pin-like site-specific DNA recombinase